MSIRRCCERIFGDTLSAVYRHRPALPHCRRQSTLPIRLALHHCSSSGRGREDLSDVAYEEGTPHTIPRTTVIHLLQSNVDLNMIHSWLGVSDDEISDYRIGRGYSNSSRSTSARKIGGNACVRPRIITASPSDNSSSRKPLRRTFPSARWMARTSRLPSARSCNSRTFFPTRKVCRRSRSSSISTPSRLSSSPTTPCLSPRKFIVAGRVMLWAIREPPIAAGKTTSLAPACRSFFSVLGCSPRAIIRRLRFKFRAVNVMKTLRVSWGRTVARTCARSAPARATRPRSRTGPPNLPKAGGRQCEPADTRTNTSVSPFVSPGTRRSPSEEKATVRPSVEMAPSP